jgi:small subunit ribosomal protein S8
MLTRIRNAQMRRKTSVICASLKAARPRSSMCCKRRLHPRLHAVELDDGKSEFSIELKYFDGAPVIRTIERVSKPGRRVYAPCAIPHVANGLGVTILSTPKGVMADHQAREENVGGEVLCRSSDRCRKLPTRNDRLNNVSYR